MGNFRQVLKAGQQAFREQIIEEVKRETMPYFIVAWFVKGKGWGCQFVPTPEYLAHELAEALWKSGAARKDGGYDKCDEVRILRGAMVARYGPLDPGGAQLISQSRYDNQIVKDA